MTPLRQRPLESRRGAATAQAREDAERKEVPAGAAGGRRLAASLDSDAALAKKTAARDAAPVLNEVATTAGPESAALRPVKPSAPKAAPPAQPLNLRAQGAFKSSVSRLDELVVAGASPPVEITFPEALKRLNGSLRLIEGLVPLRLEALGADVRVVYPLRSGELVLAERLENGKLTYRLVAPAGFPGDSLEKLRLRVRD